MRILAMIAVVGLGFPWGARAESYALLIGVNSCPNFRLPDGSAPRPLRGAEQDAEAVAAMLKERFGFAAEHMLLLKGSEASFAKIQAAFADLAKRVQPEDVFVFHFSGHGSQIADRRPYHSPDATNECICPYDATENEDNLIVDHDLARWVDRIPARQITLVLDCCHAETRGKDIDEQLAVRYLPIKGMARSKPGQTPWRELHSVTKEFDRRVTILFACQSDQMAYERRLLKARPLWAGQFTFYFLQVLQQPGATTGPNCITYQRAFGQAAARLNESFNNSRNSRLDRQDPVLATDFPTAPVFGIQVPKQATSEK